MSFRTRLVLFFVVIVVVPMVAVALMLFRLISHRENGKSNTAIAARHDVAQQLLREQRDLARVAVGASSPRRDAAWGALRFP